MNEASVDHGRTSVPRQCEPVRVVSGAPPCRSRNTRNGNYNYDNNAHVKHANAAEGRPHRYAVPERAADHERVEKEQLHAARYARRRRAKWLMIIAMLGLSCVLIYIISVFLGSFFVVGEVQITGDSPYSAQEIMSAAGIAYGDALYKIDRSDAEKAITDALPYIDNAVVTLKLPSYIYISVESEGAVMYTELPGGYYALSREMRVLECAASPLGYISAGLVYIELPEIESAVVGMPLTLADGTDPRYIGELVKTLLESELGERISRIFADERFNTVLSVDGCYRVRFGSDANAAVKALAVVRIIEENDFRGYAAAEIDVSDPSAVIVAGRDKLDLQSKRG